MDNIPTSFDRGPIAAYGDIHLTTSIREDTNAAVNADAKETVVRDFFTRSLLIVRNRLRWQRQREETAAQWRGRLGGLARARLIHAQVRLRRGGEVWRPWRAT